MRKHLAGMLIRLAHKIHPPKVTEVAARDFHYAGQNAGKAYAAAMELLR